jgi:hypothetical protein
MKPTFLPVITALFLALSGESHAEWVLGKMVAGNGDQTTFHARPADQNLLNPWPADLEAGFQKRALPVSASWQSKQCFSRNGTTSGYHAPPACERAAV